MPQTLPNSSNLLELYTIGDEVTTRFTTDDVFHRVDPDWGKLARLLLLSSLAAVGTVGNIFTISAVMVQDHLKKRGNTFIVNLALADLLVTGLVLPASTVAILAGMEASSGPVCRFQWGATALAGFVALLTLPTIAIENHLRVRRVCVAALHSAPLLPPSVCRTAPRLLALVLLIWATAGAGVAVLQLLSEPVGPAINTCRLFVREPNPIHAAVGTVLVLVPSLLALFTHTKTLLDVRIVEKKPSFKPGPSYQHDVDLVHTNFVVFFVFAVFWLPFGILLSIASLRQFKPSVYYNLSCLALSKSCVNWLVYGAMNKHFRNAFVSLFHYCCCKTNVSFSRRTRIENPSTRPSSDVRVHIIPGYNMYHNVNHTSQQTSHQTRPSRHRESGMNGMRQSSGKSRGVGKSKVDVYEL